MQKVIILIMTVILSITMVGCESSDNVLVVELNGETTGDPLTESPSTQEQQNVQSISGTTEYEGLDFSVEGSSVRNITITIKNVSDINYVIGWVDSGTAILTTSDSEYTHSVPAHTTIDKGSIATIKCSFSGVTGTPTSIRISDVITLTDRNLPLNGNSAGTEVTVPLN